MALKNGRCFSYFVDGDPADPAVLCLHGLGESKWSYLFPEPIPGVFLIAVDRMGHGGSTPHDGPPDMTKIVAEYTELLDELKVDKAYVTGHSMGGLTCVQIAAACPDRVLGIAPVSAPMFMYEKSVTAKERRKCDTTPGGMILSLNKRGCWAGFSRSCVNAMFGGQAHADKSKDYGMAAKYNVYKTKEVGGDKRSWDAMDKDPFFVTKMLDSNLHGALSPKTYVWEFGGFLARLEGPFYDIAQVRCPTFIYNGRDEASALMNAQLYHRLIEGSTLTIFDEHGHVSIGLEMQKIILALVQGKSVPANY